MVVWILAKYAFCDIYFTAISSLFSWNAWLLSPWSQLVWIQTAHLFIAMYNIMLPDSRLCAKRGSVSVKEQVKKINASLTSLTLLNQCRCIGQFSYNNTVFWHNNYSHAKANAWTTKLRSTNTSRMYPRQVRINVAMRKLTTLCARAQQVRRHVTVVLLQ